MEQLVNAATPSYYAMLGFCIFGIAIICTSIVIFIILAMTTGKESLIMSILGVLLFIPGVHFGNIFGKYNEQMTAIVKPIISENYPDATDFYYGLDAGHFTTNDIEYKIQYKKTVNNEEKLIISVKKQSNDTDGKQVTTLDIPKVKSK